MSQTLYHEVMFERIHTSAGPTEVSTHTALWGGGNGMTGVCKYLLQVLVTSYITPMGIFMNLLKQEAGIHLNPL